MWENESIMPQVVSTTDAKDSAQLSPFVLYFKKVLGSDKAMILWINFLLISFSCHSLSTFSHLPLSSSDIDAGVKKKTRKTVRATRNSHFFQTDPVSLS